VSALLLPCVHCAGGEGAEAREGQDSLQTIVRRELGLREGYLQDMLRCNAPAAAVMCYRAAAALLYMHDRLMQYAW
jgi:hypothetical protein